MKDREFLRGEFIGNSVIVCDNRMKEIAKGRVVWETKNMLHIGEPEKRFSKKGHSFIFETENGRTVVEGKKILYRPEDRIKRLR
ncbi:MAG: ribonuclease P protein subunit [Thermoplasmata archaeon]|nr:ribonuclease P protein subunit [Candidatus Sysuiplasma acidicola]MBX8646622.1 ribonuclease P protein subunit [Candidatus Sysuiplasma acidicola]MDH2905943.1 ribonuclease P protein subunit [Methanomassiliicoccales archaeon]